MLVAVQISLELGIQSIEILEGVFLTSCNTKAPEEKTKH
jgi:hypothetical protein